IGAGRSESQRRPVYLDCQHSRCVSEHTNRLGRDQATKRLIVRTLGSAPAALGGGVTQRSYPTPRRASTMGSRIPSTSRNWRYQNAVVVGNCCSATVSTSRSTEPFVLIFGC